LQDYQILKRAEIQARLKLPPDQHLTHPESGMVRALYDCPEQILGKAGKRVRIIVATHPAGKTKSRIGVERDGIVYELFLTNLSQDGFTAADVVALYLHRGAFENALADEDQEQDPDRWVSHTASGQEAWQLISQWVWNLRLELGHQLAPDPVRTTEFAPAYPSVQAQAPDPSSPPQGYGKAVVALPRTRWPFLRTRLSPPARWHAALPRRAVAGGARATQRSRWKPARGVCGQHPQLSPLPFAPPMPMGGERHEETEAGERVAPSSPGWSRAAAASRDWSRREHRRACMQLVRHQRMEVQVEQGLSASPDLAPAPLSRAQRAHYRLDFQERLARNARVLTASRVTIQLFGIPKDFAASLGLVVA
jgi:hypothetical protein